MIPICRNKHFNAALLSLNERAKNITSEYNEKRRDQSRQGMKDLISRLRYIMTLKKQLSTCNHSVIDLPSIIGVYYKSIIIYHII